MDDGNIMCTINVNVKIITYSRTQCAGNIHNTTQKST